MISIFTLAHQNLTLVGDLVDALYQHRGYAFVAPSAIGVSPVIEKRRDEIRLANLAYNRWDIRVDYAKGVATPRTLPYRLIFDPLVMQEPDPIRRLSPSLFRRKEGVYASVPEISAVIGIDPKRCHWNLARRWMWARFDTDATPRSQLVQALATAIGAQVGKDGSLDLDISTFRQQAAATLARRLQRDDYSRNITLVKDDLGRLAFASASDDVLRRVYAAPGNREWIPLSEGALNDSTIQRYVDNMLAILSNSRTESAAQWLSNNVDTKVPPQIQLFNTGGVGLVVGKKGAPGSKIVF